MLHLSVLISFYPMLLCTLPAIQSGKEKFRIFVGLKKYSIKETATAGWIRRSTEEEKAKLYVDIIRGKNQLKHFQHGST